MGTEVITTGISSVVGLEAIVVIRKAEKAELEALKSSLTGFDPSIEYVLKNHSHIKWTYYLAGTKYANETTAEEDALKAIGKSFSEHISEAVEAVDAKIKSLESQISGLEATIRTVKASIK